MTPKPAQPHSNLSAQSPPAGMSRRTFLGSAVTAVSALAFPAIIPSRALGRDGYIAPSNRIVFGVIGWGQISPGDLGELIKLPDVQFAAACEVDQPRLIAARDHIENYYRQNNAMDGWKGCATYGDFREMVARPELDAILIGTPDHWHALMTVHAARQGKDIYCEKPLSLTIAEGKAMRAAVNRYGRVLQVGSQSRSLSRVRHACELVLNGRIGKVSLVKVGLPETPYTPVQPVMPVPPGFDYDLWLGQAPWAPYTEKRCHIHFRWILDYSDGMVADWGAHQIDIAQMGMGKELTGPVEIEGRGEFPRDGLSTAATRFHITCRYADRVTMEISTAFEGGVQFVGETGWIRTGHGGGTQAEPASLLQSKIGPNEFHLYESPGHHRNFVDCVKSRALPLAPVEVGHRTATICHLCNIAMLLRRKLRWDPVQEQFVNDQEANRMMARVMREPWSLEV